VDLPRDNLARCTVFSPVVVLELASLFWLLGFLRLPVDSGLHLATLAEAVGFGLLGITLGIVFRLVDPPRPC
jgi:hypothetical protein